MNLSSSITTHKREVVIFMEVDDILVVNNECMLYTN